MSRLKVCHTAGGDAEASQHCRQADRDRRGMNPQPGFIKDACIMTSEGSARARRGLGRALWNSAMEVYELRAAVRVTDCQRLSDDPACTLVTEVSGQGATSFLNCILAPPVVVTPEKTQHCPNDTGSPSDEWYFLRISTLLLHAVGDTPPE